MPDADFMWPFRRHYLALEENLERLYDEDQKIREIKKGIEFKRELKRDLENAKKQLIESNSESSGEYVNSLQWYDDMVEEMIGAIRLSEIKINELEGYVRTYTH